MKIDRILILGSTYLTELCVDKIQRKLPWLELVGYIPSNNPTNEGKVALSLVDFDTICDIKLSIQYDMLVSDVDKCFNLHTGLLPEYGGCDILDYTLQNKATSQGLTFHKMTEKFDYGPIISRISYPVFEMDSISDLYERQVVLGPDFIVQSLNLLSRLSEQQVEECYMVQPKLYRRGKFEAPDEIKNFRLYRISNAK